MGSNDTHWLVAIITTAGIASIGWIVSKVFELTIQLRSKIYLTQEKLIFYARQIHSPGVMKEELIREADRALRGQASSIRAAADAVLVYRFWSLVGIIPPKSDVLKASSLLIGLHNSLEPLGTELPAEIAERNRKSYDKIGKLLKIDLRSGV